MNFTFSTNLNNTINLTEWHTNSSSDYDQRSPLAVLAQAASLAAIMSSSIFGNVLILLAIYMNRQLREVTSAFIANLACADLLLSIIGMPFTFSSSITYDWIFGKHLCRFHGMANGIFCFASMLSLAAVSIERFVAITKPLKYHLIMTEKTVMSMILYVWFQSIFCALLPVFGWSRYIYMRSESMCTGDWPYNIPYVLFLFTLNFFFPVIIMSYCYYHIFKTANDHSKRIKTAFECVGVLVNIEQQNQSPRDNELENYSHKNDIAQEHSMTKEQDLAQQKSVGQAVQNCADVKTTELQINTTQETKIQKTEKKYKQLQDKKAAKTLLLVMGSFLFCWAPHILGMTCLLFPSCSWPDEFFATTTWLAMMNSSCNPIIYGFLNRRFRQSFKKIVCCGKLSGRIENVER